MAGGSIRVARIAGIPVGISPLWLVIVGLITWSLGSGYYPGAIHGIAPAAAYGLGLLSALLLFASILAHEFGHAVVARRLGMEVEGIDLWLLGGVAKMSGRPHTPGDELRFALAGPAVTAGVALLFGALALALPNSAPAGVRALVDYQAEVNLLILAFNLLPAFPLDGGRVARALIWRHTADLGRATDLAAGLGRAFGYLLIGAGLLLWLNGAPGGLWFAVVGVFLIGAGNAERVQEHALEELAEVPVRDLMSTPAVSLAAASTLQDAWPQFARYRFTAFPVVDRSDRVVGLLTIHALRRHPQEQWPATTSDDAAEHDHGLFVGAGDDVAEVLQRAAFQRVGRAAVVDADGRLLGVLSITDVERALRAQAARQVTRSTRAGRSRADSVRR